MIVISDSKEHLRITVPKNTKKGIPYLRTEHLKNPTLSGGTYLYSVYKGVKPPRIFHNMKLGSFLNV